MRIQMFLCEKLEPLYCIGNQLFNFSFVQRTAVPKDCL